MAAEADAPPEVITPTGELVTMNLPEDPRARAQERLRRLRATFADSLAIIAEMHQDRDWEHLTKEDGTPYASLAEVFSDAMQVSLSMARRYVQGATKFYLPLSEVTVDGTRIEITSGSVASLGDGGLADAVETARGRLEGVDDPEEAEEIITGSLQEAKERKSAQSAEPAPSWDDPEDWGRAPGEEPFDGYDTPPAGDWPPDADEAEPAQDTEPAATPLSSVLEDPVAKVLDGARRFDDPAARDELEPPLRDVTAALFTLAEMDPDELARTVTYDTRGVLVPVGEAMDNAARLRALVETHPWYMARLTA